MIRILIVDDHSIVRRGLKQIVEDEPDLLVVGEAANTDEMLAFVRTKPCDVVVTDISMPGRSGLEALKEVKQERPELPVLVLSVHPEGQYGARALQLGASGYLTKDSAPEELVQAIRKVVSGGKYVSPTLAEQLAFDVATDTKRPNCDVAAEDGIPPHQTLSKREHEVLCLIAKGKSPTEIADELALSVKTIATYRLRILEKMAMRTTAQLVHYGITQRLGEAPPPDTAKPPALAGAGARSASGRGAHTGPADRPWRGADVDVGMSLRQGADGGSSHGLDDSRERTTP